MITGLWVGHLKEKNHSNNVGVYVRIILKWMFKKWNWGED
jgi:hypothetical protein